ncbi:MAG: hypothetical protein MUF87_03705 [Anaerolineae bacterium]|jgi:Tol biopolymer transport system component|nr:hypothetical protein [Anaerolineae bacterium]
MQKWWSFILRISALLLCMQIVLIAGASLLGRLQPREGWLTFMSLTPPNGEHQFLQVERHGLEWAQQNFPTWAEFPINLPSAPAASVTTITSSGTTTTVTMLDQPTWNIFVMDADRRLSARLTWNQNAHSRFPAWSPDGRYLVYHEGGLTMSDYDLFVRRLDGRGYYQLTYDDLFTDQPDQNHLGNAMAAWSPDGQRIGFHSDVIGNWSLFMINPDGTDLTQVTFDNGEEIFWDWSWDGSQIAFSKTISDDLTSTWFVHVMNPDGTDITPITYFDDPQLSPSTGSYAQIQETHPSWSPDGTRIVFSSNREGGTNLYIIEVSTGEITRLTDDILILDYNPIWISEHEILFISDRAGLSQVFLLELTSGDIRQLTYFESVIEGPAWLR